MSFRGWQVVAIAAWLGVAGCQQACGIVEGEPTDSSSSTGGSGGAGTTSVSTGGGGASATTSSTGGGGASATTSSAGGGGATCADAVRNGDEAAVDCGGSCPDKCPNGETCGKGSDCISTQCGQESTCERFIDVLSNGDAIGPLPPRDKSFYPQDLVSAKDGSVVVAGFSIVGLAPDPACEHTCNTNVCANANCTVDCACGKAPVSQVFRYDPATGKTEAVLRSEPAHGRFQVAAVTALPSDVMGGVGDIVVAGVAEHDGSAFNFNLDPLDGSVSCTLPPAANQFGVMARFHLGGDGWSCSRILRVPVKSPGRMLAMEGETDTFLLSGSEIDKDGLPVACASEPLTNSGVVMRIRWDALGGTDCDWQRAFVGVFPRRGALALDGFDPAKPVVLFGGGVQPGNPGSGNVTNFGAFDGGSDVELTGILESAFLLRLDAKTGNNVGQPQVISGVGNGYQNATASAVPDGQGGFWFSVVGTESLDYHGHFVPPPGGANTVVYHVDGLGTYSALPLGWDPSETCRITGTTLAPRPEGGVFLMAFVQKSCSAAFPFPGTSAGGVGKDDILFGALEEAGGAITAVGTRGGPGVPHVVATWVASPPFVDTLKPVAQGPSADASWASLYLAPHPWGGVFATGVFVNGSAIGAPAVTVGCSTQAATDGYLSAANGYYYTPFLASLGRNPDPTMGFACP